MKMNWISVKDKLPDNEEEVLIYNHRDGIGLGYFDKNSINSYKIGWKPQYDWSSYEAQFIPPTHWMPLPHFPEEDIYSKIKIIIYMIIIAFLFAFIGIYLGFIYLGFKWMITLACGN